MAKATTTDDSTPTGITAEQLTQSLTDAMRATAPARKVTPAEYRTSTPFNPEGKKNHERPKLTRQYLQNGTLIQLWHITDEDIALLNKLKRGRYIDRKVEVVVRGHNNGDKDTVEIRYRNKTIEQRMDLTSRFRSFTELLTLIVAEQATKPARRAPRDDDEDDE